MDDQTLDQVWSVPYSKLSSHQASRSARSNAASACEASDQVAPSVSNSNDQSTAARNDPSGSDGCLHQTTITRSEGHTTCVLDAWLETYPGTYSVLGSDSYHAPVVAP